MAINLELPGKMRAVIDTAHQGAAEMMRPIARKYDQKEHAYPVELDTLAELFAGATAANTLDMAGVNGLRSSESNGENRNGANLSAVLQALEASWGDAAMLLSIPFQGLGNAAVSAVATDEQLERLGRVWAAMAITEPGFGSDSAAVSTTAKLDGDDYVINGEKIYVTAGSRATHIVVWATLDKSKGRAAIKSFIVPREHPGVTVERLENKLGIKGSDTAAIRFENARVPKNNLLGNPEIESGKGFSGVMETFDNTRPGGRRDGRRYCPRHPGRAAQDPDQRGRRDLLRQARTGAERRRIRVPPDGGRVGICLPADPACGVAGRQQHSQLQRSVDVQGQGRPGG